MPPQPPVARPPPPRPTGKKPPPVAPRSKPASLSGSPRSPAPPMPSSRAPPPPRSRPPAPPAAPTRAAPPRPTPPAPPTAPPAPPTAPPAPPAAPPAPPTAPPAPPAAPLSTVPPVPQSATPFAHSTPQLSVPPAISGAGLNLPRSSATFQTEAPAPAMSQTMGSANNVTAALPIRTEHISQRAVSATADYHKENMSRGKLNVTYADQSTISTATDWIMDVSYVGSISATAFIPTNSAPIPQWRLIRHVI